MNERIRTLAMANEAFTQSKVTSDEVLAFAAMIRESEYDRLCSMLAMMHDAYRLRSNVPVPLLKQEEK